jgi:hypothetical protein
MTSLSGKELGKFLPGVPHAAEALTNGFARSTILADGSLHPQLVPCDFEDLPLRTGLVLEVRLGGLHEISTGMRISGGSDAGEAGRRLRQPDRPSGIRGNDSTVTGD